MRIEEMIAARRADCSGCEACANICPQNAIEMTRDAEGFAYPKINPALCIKCGRCDATCPALNFKEKIPVALPKIFAAVYDDDKIRRHSSSGGIFSALSEIILQNGGVVFGAAFDKNWRVIHTAAQNFDELENLRGSKYVQSQIGDVYRQVKDALRSTLVLFSGTPCQCAGLKHFLGSDPDNLLTVEIICHGVPSPALWEYYIDYIGYAHDIKHVNFRNKRKGWKDVHFEVNYLDRVRYSIPFAVNLYTRLFSINTCLRPSCSACKFRFPDGQADLTIGDAWGVENFAPEMFDNRGTSLVFIHTAKGKTFLEQSNLIAQPVSFIDATKYNFGFIISVTEDPRREYFFADFANNADKIAVMEKYCYQDDTDIRKAIRQQNKTAYQKNLQDILEQIRQQFDKNILIIAAPNDINLQNVSAYLYTPQFQNCGIYLLQTNDSENFFLTEIFSLLSVDMKSTADILDFMKSFNISEIHVDNSIKNYFPNFNSWLNDCGLPVRHIAFGANNAN